VYVGSDDNYIYALDAKTGKEIWKFETNYPIESPPAIYGGVVYVRSNDYVFALDAISGKEIWRFKGGSKYSGPSISNGVVYTGDSALDAKTGKEILLMDVIRDMVTTSPVVSNGIVYVGTFEGEVIAIGDTPIASQPNNPVTPPVVTDETPKNKVTEQWDIEFGGPITVDQTSDNILIGLDMAGVEIISPKGVQLNRWKDYYEDDEYVPLLDIYSFEDKIFLLLHHAVLIFSMDGTFIREFNLLKDDYYYPLAIVVDNNGDILVAYNKFIRKYDNMGNLIDEWGKEGVFFGGEVYYINDLEFGPDNTLYVVDKDAEKIQVFKDLYLIGSFGNLGSSKTKLNNPQNIAVSNDGNIYVSEPDIGRISIFNEEGNNIDAIENIPYCRFIAVDKKGRIFSTSISSNKLLVISNA